MLEMKVPKDGVIKFNELERGQIYFISFEEPVVISTTEFNHNQQLKRDDYYKPTEVFVLEEEES